MQNSVREIALALGVKAITKPIPREGTAMKESEFGGVPFGQREKLTQRIKNILRELSTGCDSN